MFFSFQYVVEQFKYMLKTYFSLFFSVVLCVEQCLKIKFEGGGGRKNAVVVLGVQFLLSEPPKI
jgi:hypothetical protein